MFRDRKKDEGFILIDQTTPFYHHYLLKKRFTNPYALFFDIKSKKYITL